jgi:hypothetical protein
MKLGLLASILALVPIAAPPADLHVERALVRIEDPPLDEAWIASLGRVSVFAPRANRLRIEIERLAPDPISMPSEGAWSQAFDLDTLPKDARVQSARIGPLMTSGFVVALAVKEGDSTAYHYLQCLAQARAQNLMQISRLESRWWSFSDALFTSTGDSYRIVDAHGTNSGDGLEITFRRGWQQPTPNFVATVDEKVYFNSCVLAGAKTGAGTLLDVEKFRPSH